MTQNIESVKDATWCVIPVYNNKGTIKEVALGCKREGFNVLVVDDGSEDVDVAALLADTGIPVLTHETNQGKGEAVLTGLRFVKERGARFMITIDADAQHDPEDIKKFLPLLAEDPASIVIGCRDMDGEHVPGKSRFGRAFSNFWLRLETGVAMPDTQSGFRAYPVEYLSKLKLKGHRYDFEVEVLARAIWAGLSVQSVDVGVWYAPPDERISSFRPFMDNLRITWTHTKLITRRLFPWPVRQLVRHQRDMSIFRSPRKLIQMLLRENATPAGLAASAGVGIFIAVLPIFAFHTIVIILVTTRLNLNRVMAVAIQNLCAPPFVPLLCVELGYYMRHGEWLTVVSRETLLSQLHLRFYEWWLGSLIFAPLLAVFIGGIVFFIAHFLQRVTGRNE